MRSTIQKPYFCAFCRNKGHGHAGGVLRPEGDGAGLAGARAGAREAVQQRCDGFGVASFGCGDGRVQLARELHVRDPALILGLFRRKVGLQLRDPALQVLHVHAFKGLQALFGGGELLLQGIVVSKGLLCRLDVPAVLRHDGVDDLFGERRVADLEVVQKLSHHVLSFLRYAFYTWVASTRVFRFTPGGEVYEKTA